VLRQRVAMPRWINEVRLSAIARQPRIVYSRTEDRSVFMIDGRVMDDDRVDQMVKLGDTEAWTIVNTDQQYHSFHIHQTPFLVTEVNGVCSLPTPCRSRPQPTSGRARSHHSVYGPRDRRQLRLSHAVHHEDKGMMGSVLVVA